MLVKDKKNRDFWFSPHSMF